jgi:single-strand DNA-binding protein
MGIFLTPHILKSRERLDNTQGDLDMYHQLIVVGNLGRDPEMRYAPSGQAVTNFSVASNRQWTSADGTEMKETIWLRINVWGKQAEACNQYLKKGSKVLVEGRLNPDPKTGGPKVYEGKNGPAASFEVTASTVRFLSSHDKTDGGSEGEGASEPEGDIPF